ncbi:MAG: RibD family protein, partial [Pseudomonadota bacterium]
LIKRKRPFVSLKIATSLDAKIADYQGGSKWITCDAARQYGHLLRAKNDAILTGIATVLADNPSLDCRIKGLENNSPQRVVLDRNLRIGKDAKILPAWIFSYDIEGEAIKELQKNGSQIFSCSESEFTLENVLLQLGQLGITRLLIEAGSRLSSAFLRENLVDKIYWFRSPMIIGKNGLNAIEGDDLPLAKINRYRLVELKQVGGDVLEVYDIKP